MNNEMIRYSRNPTKNNRKNALYTIRDGDVIYFGIARCNKKAGDLFDKNTGRQMAKNRAKVAKQQVVGSFSASFLVFGDGLVGACRVPYMHLLLSYFNNIDETMKRK